jgi:hypothetical protein
VFAFIESAIILTLLAIFGTDPQRPVEISKGVVAHALATALFSPPIFRIAQRLQQGASSVTRNPNGGGAT